MYLIDLGLEVNTSCWVVIFMCFSFFFLFVVSHMSEFDALLASRRSF